MITINQLLDGGITIQGKVKIQAWKNDECVVLFESDDFECDNTKLDYYIGEHEITYMFSNDGVFVIEISIEE